MSVYINTYICICKQRTCIQRHICSMHPNSTDVKRSIHACSAPTNPSHDLFVNRMLVISEPKNDPSQLRPSWPLNSPFSKTFFIWVLLMTALLFQSLPRQSSCLPSLVKSSLILSYNQNFQSDSLLLSKTVSFSSCKYRLHPDWE